MIPGGAFAAEDIIKSVDLGGIQEAADAAGAGISVYDMVSGIASGDMPLGIEAFTNAVRALAAPFTEGFSRALVLFSIPPVLSAICGRCAAKSMRASGLICACGCASAFIAELTRLMSVARELLEWISSAASAALPAMTALAALAGATGSNALLTPMAGAAGDLITGALSGFGVKLCAALAALAAATAFAPAMRLDGLFSLGKSVVTWGAGLLLASFVGILTVQGMLGASYDSAAVRTARYAVDNLIPVVGGDIADSLDAALSSILLVKSAVGVTGIAVIALGCGQSLAELFAAYLGARAAHAITLCAAQKDVSEAVSRFADVIRALLILCAAAMLIALVMTGAAICAGRAVLR